MNRIDLLHRMPKGGIAAELGTARGRFAYHIFNILQPQHLYLIDKWQESRLWRDNDSTPTFYSGVEQMIITAKKFTQQITNNRVTMLVGDTSTTLSSLGVQFDFIYIDACHEYEAVKKDLAAAYSKIKDGGWIAGHDYTEDKDFGVIQAVNEFCSEHNQSIEYITDEPAIYNQALDTLVSYNSFAIKVSRWN